MSYHNYPTHLGGELANLDLVDLSPTELAWATVGSPGKARALMELAQEQIDAATEQNDTMHIAGYTETLRRLSRMANLESFRYN